MSAIDPASADPSWWAALPPTMARVTCGEHTHRLRWAAGGLTAEDHPDAEGELVLAALGGEQAACVTLVESWGARGDDLEVLAVGPRSAADELTISQDDVAEMRQFPGGWIGTGPLRTGPMITPRRPWPGAVPRARLARGVASYGATSGVTARAGGFHGGTAYSSTRITASARISAGRGLRAGGPLRQHPELDRASQRRIELFSLLALGPAFQLRLAGTVAAAWADGGRRADDRAPAAPALAAALAGRLAPAACDWLGVDPELVEVTLHEDTGWGRLAAAGERGLRAALPVGWLASVWAAGLAVVAGHLVVAVQRAAWPRATVLAVREPGAGPVILEVRATDGGWVADAAG